ncbi:MAG TPA: carbonic anhydrase [Caulobacterales bacterium]|nr:carbonic anhydrase [Caulobacterales bacterium]
MQQLLAGYRHFRARTWPRLRETYESLAAGQAPEVLVIACSDSRVDPTRIFDSQPGELFVIRNVAAIVPPFEENPVGMHGTSAAIEFAVEKLRVRTILILGHGRCGGVAAALDGAQTHGVFIDGWIDLLGTARSRIAPDSADIHGALERESIRVSLERLMGFPFVARAVQEGRLTLEGALFDIADGRLERLDPATGKFVHVDDHADSSAG